MVALVLLVASLTLAWGQNGQDRGIGGTGVVSDDPDGDRGIGGTGMMGRIRGFGSIIVNGRHVNYAPDVPVRIDGQTRAVSDLKIGQVVRVVAENRNGVLATRQIDVTSEVVGPIEATGRKTLTVLGQTVATQALGTPGHWQRGDRVAVFGLRRPDGTIVASLIERREGGSDRIAGQVTRSRNGSLGIGTLKLAGVDPALVGNRVVLEGSYANGTLQVTGTARERDLLGANVRRFSIEAYVERTRNGLRLGSGLEVTGRPASTLPVGSYAPAVVTVVTDRRGRLGIEGVSLEGQPTSSRGLSQGVDRENSRNTPADARGRGPAPRDTHPGSGSSRRDSSLGDARGRDGHGGSSGNRSGDGGNNGNGNGGGNQGGGRGGDHGGGGPGGGSGGSGAGGGGGNGNGGGNGGDQGGGGNGDGNGGGGKR
ncbi:hypothetical protein JQC81_14840 [Microvirga arabica]|nr:hypothetical protein [Microvirga arabica]